MCGVEGVVTGDLHFAFGIVHVGERRVVHCSEHRFAARGAKRGHQSQVLDRHGIALLRHDRAHLDESVGDGEMSDLESRPRVQVLDETPGVDEEKLERRVHAGCIVGGGDASVGILLRIGKAQELGHPLAVEPEARRGDRRRPHAGEVDRARRVQQPIHVPQRQLDERREVMAVGRRLRGLAVRVSDDDGVALPLGDGEQALDQRDMRIEQRRQPILERELEHRVVDVVTAAAGVELAGDFDTEPADELAFDVEEEVLVLARVRETLEIERPDDVVERFQDDAGFLPFEQSALGEQHGTRLG